MKDSVRECECTEKEPLAVLFRMKSSHQGTSALCLVRFDHELQKHNEKATAESIQVTKMPIVQLPEMSVEDEAWPPKSPGKSQCSD